LYGQRWQAYRHLVLGDISAPALARINKKETHIQCAMGHSSQRVHPVHLLLPAIVIRMSHRDKIVKGRRHRNGSSEVWRSGLTIQKSDVFSLGDNIQTYGK